MGNKQCILYTYVLTNESNFAPCIDKDINGENLLSLVCCKGGKNGGMRLSIAKEFLDNPDKEIWILGLCGKTLAQNLEKANQTDAVYSPIYLAKVDEVFSMDEYYRDKDGLFRNRFDNKAYKLDSQEVLRPTNQNPHLGYDNQIAADIGGQFAILSRCFSFWGIDCGKTIKKTSLVSQLGEYANGILISCENKKGIEDHYRGYIICKDFEGLDLLLDSCGMSRNQQSSNFISNGHITDNYVESSDEYDETKIICSCSH